jgi:hypothetical protein
MDEVLKIALLNEPIPLIEDVAGGFQPGLGDDPDVQESIMH